MKNQIRDKIISAKSIVILTHTNQDLDAIGSSFAMRDVLRNMGKNAVCCLEGDIERRAKFFGDDFITENKAGEYDLAIVLDCGSIDRLGTRVKIYESAKEKVSVDHHMTNTLFAPYNYVEPDAAATGPAGQRRGFH